MARVPTWTELRLDAEKLVSFQDEFDERLNNLLLHSLPQLDRKILSLDANRILDTTLMWPINEKSDKKTLNLSKPTLPFRSESLSTSTPLSSLTSTSSPPSLNSHQIIQEQIEQEHQMLSQKTNLPQKTLNSRAQSLKIKSKSNNHTEHVYQSITPENIFIRPKSPSVQEPYNQPKIIYNTNEFDIHMHEPLKNAHPYYATVIDIPYMKKRDRSYPDENLPATKSPKQNIVRSQTLNENLSKNCVNNNTNGFNKKISPRRIHKKQDIDFNKLPHLMPPDRPLSEYLRLNRPEVVLRADRRVLYLKKSSEKRKFLASSRIINSLEQIRISSRSSTMSNRIRQNQNNKFNTNRNNYGTLAPNYHVKSKLTEHEMKRLTARIYNRLPEVKNKRKEEITNHMKVQNYKNKLEYGRKLLENRRHGVINYPLRLNYDDRSIDSSQDEYSVTTNCNNYLGSADLSSSIDPYY